MLSIIIPARNEIYLERTIKNILENAEGEIEILAMLDGYMPDPPIDINDNRVTFYHYEKSIGQRQCINEGAKKAKGKYIMKLDAHCAVDKGFDVKLIADSHYNWTVVPRMYNLNHETWEPKLHKRTDYMYIGWKGDRLLRAEYYGARQPKNDKLIDETMCCMGPGWFMEKDRFWELGGMDENHGGWGQMGVEVAFKAWLSGGALMVNKKTWFAHWFRGGSGPGFPYHITYREQERARMHSKDLWLNNKWEKQIKTYQWLFNKFNPPGWSEYNIEEKFDRLAYHLHFVSNECQSPNWLGVRTVKYPGDLILYQEIIYNNKPDYLIETGTFKGGSALFFASIMDLIGKGKVISVDMNDRKPPEHPRITYVIGRTTDKDTLDKVKSLIEPGSSVMVSLDSNHHRTHVKRELVKYGPMVTKGQYMVVEDTVVHDKNKSPGPKEAVEWFMKGNKNFKQEPLENRFIYSLQPGGWLRRVR